MKSFLRSALLGASTLTLSVLLGSSAHAGVGCLDACDQICLMRNYGCSPFTLVCAPCLDDRSCQPGGTCGANGECLNVQCGDAGVPTDGGPALDGAVIDAGGAADAGDSGTSTSTIPDASVTDTGPTPAIDSGPPADSGPRLSTAPYIRDEVYDPGCECTATSMGGPAPWSGLALLAGLALRRRRKIAC